MARLNISFLGTGRIAEAHLAAFAALPDVALAGIFNRSGRPTPELTAKYGVEYRGTDWRQEFSRKRPDAVVVLVSHEQTATVVEQVLELGIPVLLEKPPALDLNEALRLAELAKVRNVLNMVGFNRRFYSTIRQAIQAVHAAGPLMGVHIEMPEPIALKRQEGRLSARVYDNWFLVNSIHAVDLLRFLGGEVAALHVERASWLEPGPDSFSATLRFSSGALGSFIAHWHSGGSPRLVLYGDGVRAELASFLAGTLHRRDGTSTPIVADKLDSDFKPGFFLQAQAFVEALKSARPVAQPGGDLQEACQTMQLVWSFLGRSPCA